VTRSRRDLFDIPRKIYLDEELDDWADLCCNERDWSFSRYVRLLIKDHKKKVKELSAKPPANNRANEAPNQAHPKELYTAEQVALLLDAMGKK